MAGLSLLQIRLDVPRNTQQDAHVHTHSRSYMDNSFDMRFVAMEWSVAYTTAEPQGSALVRDELFSIELLIPDTELIPVETLTKRSIPTPGSPAYAGLNSEARAMGNAPNA